HRCDALFSADLGPRPHSERLRMAVSPLLALRAARRVWRQSGPYDVLDASGAEAWLVALAARCGQFPGATVIARSHGLDHLYYRELLADHRAGLRHKPWWRRLLYPAIRLAPEGWAHRLAHASILLNPRERALARRRRWQPARGIHVIPHGVDPDRCAAASPPGAPRGRGLLFVGGWYSAKGCAYLADAHARLVAAGDSVPLTIAGVGAPGDPFAPLERMVRAAFPASSQPHLTVLPRVRDADEVYALYRSHDLLVCPSTAEGFGLVVFEALSQRLPVIVSRRAGAAACLMHGENAWIIPARDAEALAEAVARLWHDPALRRQLADAGHRHAREFPWRRAAERTLAAYAAVLETRS
ncbi:MAG: glycosyltransferase family 4 protein, partial [Terriglobales bacterium]